MNRPEDYIKAAVLAIRFAQDREELLQWWEDERANRELYDVFGVHEKRLRDLCRHHLSIIEATGYKKKVSTPAARGVT